MTVGGDRAEDVSEKMTSRQIVKTSVIKVFSEDIS